MTKQLDARLSKLEVKHKPPVTVHCVAIGDNPPLKADGSVCHQHHDLMVTLGGAGNWIRFVVGDAHDGKTN